MGNRKKGRSVKKNPQAQALEPEHLTRAPHSFVIHRGEVGRYIRSLTRDFRKIMEPFTASSLVVKKKNTIKDFVSVAGLLHVSHLVMFTCTEISPYMRIARLPQGPTLTFKIHNYILARDVVSSIKKQMPHNKYFNDPPLVVLNGFSGEGTHMKLMASMFQGMFPTINVTKVNLNVIRRCLLISYKNETKHIEIRHYGIRVAPVGLSRGINKLVKGKVPDLSRYDDIAEFLTKGDILSESEVEDDPNSHVILPQKISTRGNMICSQSSIRLTEIGPRFTLQLLKVEGGLLDGEVMFHEYIQKTKEEIELIAKQREHKRKLKLKRKKEQEINVKKKEALKTELKNKSLEGMKKKKDKPELETDRLMKLSAKEGEEAVNNDDDDKEWYKKEVGEEPGPELFQNTGTERKGILKRKRDMARFQPKKRQRPNNRRDQNDNPRRKKVSFGTKVKQGKRY